MEPNYNNNQNNTPGNTHKFRYSTSNTWYVNLSSFTMCLLLYYLFTTFTSDIYYYESTECVDLLKHCTSISMLYYYYAFVTGIFFMTGLIGIDLSGLKICLQISVTVITAVYLVLVTKDLFKGEPCGELNLLALVWAIYGWVEVACLCFLSGCVIFALGAGVALASTRRD